MLQVGTGQGKIPLGEDLLGRESRAAPEARAAQWASWAWVGKGQWGSGAASLTRSLAHYSENWAS